jgi:hypothetical protein
MGFFTWTVAWGGILMVDNLRRRGIILVNWCCPCKKNEETVNHFLLHCENTSDLLVLNLFGVSWTMPNNIQELLHCWTQGRGLPKGVMLHSSTFSRIRPEKVLLHGTFIIKCAMNNYKRVMEQYFFWMNSG